MAEQIDRAKSAKDKAKAKLTRDKSPSPHSDEVRITNPMALNEPSPRASIEIEEADERLYDIFFKSKDIKDGISIVQFNAVLKTRLGFELRFDEMQRLFADVAGASGIIWEEEQGRTAAALGNVIEWDALKAWWDANATQLERDKRKEGKVMPLADEDVAFEDLVLELRRLLRLEAIFAAAREALATVAAKDGASATKDLFNTIDSSTDTGASMMRLTLENVEVLCKDLDLQLTKHEIRAVVEEMDPTNHSFVNYKAFEDWWRLGVAHAGEYDDEFTAASGGLRSMLRIGGLLTSQSSTVTASFAGAKSITSDADLLDGIDVALQSITTNAAGHVGHLFDAAQLISDEDHKVQMEGLSLGLLTPENGFRKLANTITQSVPFEVFVLVCILSNLAVLGVVATVRKEKVEMEASGASTADAQSALDILGASSWFFSTVFTLEMFMRVAAQGFVVGPGTYLQNWWNRFDFFVIMCFWLDFFATLAGIITGESGVTYTLTALRSFRALRFFRGTRQIMTVLGHAANTLILMVVLIVVVSLMFAVVGRELFGGALSRTCKFKDPNATVLDDGQHRRLGDFDDDWYVNSTRRQLGGYGDDWYTTQASDICPTTFECTEHCFEKIPKPGPKYREMHIDKFGFDDMTQSFLTTFSICALDEWMHISDPIRNTEASTTAIAWPFFAVGVVILGLLSVNLFLASITFAYLEVRQEERQEDALGKAHRTLVAVLMNPEGLLLNQAGAFEPASQTTMDTTGFGDWCRRVVDSTNKVKLDDVILIVVVLNTIAMALESHKMDQTLSNVLYVLEIFFTVIYTFEATAKIGAWGFGEYFGQTMNRMDFFIVASAIFGYSVELWIKITTDETAAGGAGGGASLRLIRLLRVLRAMRAVRLGKLIFRAESIRRTLSQAFSSLYAVWSLVGMLAFIMLVTSVLGVHLFWECHKDCNQFEDADCVYTRGHYGNVGNAFLANYQLFSRDNWASIMYEYMDCTRSKAAAMYWVIMFTVMNFILVPIFVSIFLNNFAHNDEQKRSKQVEIYVKSTLTHSKGMINLTDVKYINMGVRMLYKGSKVLKRAPLTLIGNQTRASSAQDEAFGYTKSETRNPAMMTSMAPTPSPEASAEEPEHDDKALGIFPEDSGFRTAVTGVVNSPVFQYFITIVIALSGIAMAAEGPDGKEHTTDMRDLLDAAEYAFYTIFLVEFILKIISMGFYSTPDPYLGHVSNIFDFLVVFVTSIDMVLRIAGVDAAWVQSIRLMRTLRMVRLLVFIEGMGVMAQAIAKCFPSVAAIIVLLLGNIVVFAIIGMNLFMGAMWSCNEGHGVAYPNPAYSEEKCIAEFGADAWVNSDFNFDSFSEALATLSVCSTRQGWYLIFYDVADSAEEPGEAPVKESQVLTASIFFCTFILINGYMMEELFVGMLVEVFSQTSGTVLLTAAQKKLRYVQMFLFHKTRTERPAPSHHIAVQCYNLIQTPAYKQTINVISTSAVTSLILNEAIYEIKDSPDGLGIFDLLNTGLLLLYTLHITVRSIAFHNWGYLKEAWYDFVIVVIVWVVTVIGLLQHGGSLDEHDVGWLQALQSLRVFWLIEVLNSWAPMRKLVHTIRLSVPQTVNIATLFLLVLFVFGIAAMKLYGDVDYMNPATHNVAINSHAHFGDIKHSMMLLAQIATGHPLPALVAELRNHPLDYNGNDISTNSVLPFMFIFFVISNFVFLNLFIALLLENFEYIWEGEYAIEEVDVDSLEKHWVEVVGGDKAATLSVNQLWSFVDTLEGALTIVIHTDPFWYNRLLLELDLDSDDVTLGTAQVGKEELLLALTRMRYGNSCLPFELEVEAEQKLKQSHEEAALKLLRVFVGAWRLLRTPPPGYTDPGREDDLKRFKTAVTLARLWAVGVVIRNSRLTRHQSWHAQDVENTIRNHGRFAQITQQIMDFDSQQANEDGAYPDLEIAFPKELNEMERKHVHTIAEEYHLQHGSVGEGAGRHIRVWRTGDHHSGVNIEHSEQHSMSRVQSSQDDEDAVGTKPKRATSKSRERNESGSESPFEGARSERAFKGSTSLASNDSVNFENMLGDL